MVELEKRISGDWIEIKSKANNLPGLLEFLAVPALTMRSASGKLRHCVEQGIVEFKRTLLAPVLVALETSRYKSLDGAEMGEHEGSLSLMLLAILVQRLLATQVLPLSKQQKRKAVVDVETVGLNAILADINARVKANPAIRANLAVKNILMQVQLYTRENQKMRELLPTIKPDMRTAFLANFTRTFGNIVGSIRRQYATLLEEQVESLQSSQDTFSLANLPMKDLAPLLATQAREISRMRSTFGHARDEKYRTREILVRLYESRQGMLKMIEDESRMYRRVCQKGLQPDLDACALWIANAYRDEIAGILDRQGKRDSAT
ncbi:MAG TPA: hypothetical protein VFH83_11335 [Spirochaetia bacterium]|nr:hypothetical protein [Spirochaetia bacterium]